MNLFSKSLFLLLVCGLFTLNASAENSTEKLNDRDNSSRVKITETSEDDYSLSGKITDPNGDPLAGVKVTLQGKFGGAERQIITDADGNFRFESLPEGDYLIKVEANGFSTVVRETSLRNNVAGELEIVLSVGTINEKVTVTATRTQVATIDTAVPVTVLDREELEQKPINTIGDVFRDLPGTSTTGEGAFQVRPRIRGLESNRILILVDGERLNNARTSTGQSGIEPGLVDVEQIETIEVVRGAGSVLYGTDALAGTVNIITRDAPQNQDGSFRFGGSFNGYFSSNEKGRRGSLAATGSNKFFSFRVAQTLERYGTYYTGDTTGLGFDATDGFPTKDEVGNSQSHAGNTQITTRFFINGDNDVRLNYERRRGADIGSPLLTTGFGFLSYFPYSDRDKFNGRYETRNLTDNLAKVSVSGYYQRQKRNFSNLTEFLPFVSSFSETITDTKSAGFDGQSNWIFGKNFLTAGVSFFRDDNQDTRLTLNRISGAANRTTSVPRGFFGSIAGFVQDEFELTKRLKLVGGVRVERFFSGSEQTTGFALPLTLTATQIETLGIQGLDSGLQVGETAMTGDFGLVFRVTDAVSLTGRIGRSFRVANLFERFFTGAGSVAGSSLVGNPNLKPESGINFDTGVKVKTSKFAGSFTYFNNYYRDFLSTQYRFNIPRVVGGAANQQLFQTVNLSRVRIQGVEAELEAPFQIGDAGFLTPGGNFSYLRGDNTTTNEPLNITPPFKTVLNLRWDDLRSRYFGEFQTRIVSKQDRLSNINFTSSNLGPEPGFAVSDIRGGYNFRRERYRLNFNAGVTNLFDRFYSEQFVFAPARGRSFVFGTTWELF